jgi:hypothetical protein
MKIPNDIKALVREQAQFIHFEDGKLWYQILYSTDESAKDVFGDGYTMPAIFEFPVPIEDTAGARFLRSDKGIFFMRWIRKHIEFLNTAHTQEVTYAVDKSETNTDKA